MKVTLYERFACLTRTRYRNHIAAQQALHVAYAHGIRGSMAESCLRCGGYHIYWAEKPLDQRRIFWFAITMALFAFVSVGAWICKGDLGFILWILSGFSVACMSTFWQYGKLQ